MSKLANENPYTPPTEAGLDASLIVEYCSGLCLWVLMPFTMLYVWVRHHEEASYEPSVREEIALEIVSLLQWPIGWLCIVGYFVYSL